MKLTFLGATGTVTGSKYLLTSETKSGGEKRIMIDCGLFKALSSCAWETGLQYQSTQKRCMRWCYPTVGSTSS